MNFLPPNRGPNNEHVKYSRHSDEGYVVTKFNIGDRVTYVASFKGKALLVERDIPEDDVQGRNAAARRCMDACEAHHEDSR